VLVVSVLVVSVLVASVLVTSVLVVSVLVVSVLVASVLAVSVLVVLVVSVLVALGSVVVAAAAEAFVAPGLLAFGLAAGGLELVAATRPPRWLVAADAAAFGAGAEPRPPRVSAEAPAPRDMGAPGDHAAVCRCDPSMPSGRLFAIATSLRAA
jgi:hypothetical protein